ncbi:hypothetical protein MIT9_P2625 [Methylomarinovum caldicuralii]|uniref:Glycine zipper 2TM domain-containing protein n=1 Tax=Methylomarinovum caldicuralii TaxID=438856 RepID=A0AAU9C748_9GAMM|nr:YMGG-like glycine zipper-containing protein [Methylomarinovum caldicuralii]BCX83034.1 hypothetical protein MIT9_P2625 [Methylomarinovum caldicuralii]
MKHALILLVSMLVLGGCATYPGGYGYGYQASPQVYQGAAVGAAVGAGAGALLDKHNRWRGAVIGAGLGSLLGGGLAGVQQRQQPVPRRYNGYYDYGYRR